MVKIHSQENGDVILAMIGRIDKEHIAELQALIGAHRKDRSIVLDLKDMTLTGQDGIDFLAQCEAAGVVLANCDPYVREWITIQKNEH
jgi:anti-anti-sigma regulatory factor